MVNAWGLLGSILNGTLDEDYPIMTEKNVGVRTDQEFWEEDGHSVVVIHTLQLHLQILFTLILVVLLLHKQ